jgi:hypothetical protein
MMEWRLCYGEALEGEGPHSGYLDSDNGGCPDDYKSANGMVITFGGAVDWRSRKQKLTAQFPTDAKYYAFGVGCIRLTQISLILN